VFCLKSVHWVDIGLVLHLVAKSKRRNRRSAPTRSTPKAPSNRQPSQRPVQSSRRPSATAWHDGSGWLEKAISLLHGYGIPTWTVVVGAGFWLLAIVLGVAGVISGGFAVFLGTLLSAGVALGATAAHLARGKAPLRAMRAIVVLLLALFIPLVIDPHTFEVVELPKFTLLVVGAMVLTALWVVEAVHYRRLPQWRNGLQWFVFAIALWTAISAFVGVDSHVGLLGYYGSYDGLYSAIAFAVVMMTVAESLDALDLGKLLGFFAFAGGGVVSLYGLLQLHDSLAGGARWDFVHWGVSAFGNDIFSTLGNPNHLAGYLAMLLPVILVAGVRAKRRAPRVLIALFGLVVLVELLRTAARGAWVAAIVSLAVLALLLLPELRRRPIISLGAAGAGVAVVALGMVLLGRKLLEEPLSQLFRSGGTSPVGQRFLIWRAAFHIALDHPVTGVGPDSLVLVYPQYQSRAWVAGLGPNYLVNGAHDIFMNILADQGFVGLALMVALLVFVGLRAAGGWRRLRRLEVNDGTDRGVVEDARDQRLLLAAVTASIVAYVVQATFNVQKIGLSFSFWLMVGALAAMARRAGVPDSLSPRTLLRPSSLGGGDGWQVESPAASRNGRRHRHRNADLRVWGPSVLVAIVCSIAVVWATIGAVGPYRADHAFWAAPRSASQSVPGAYALDLQRAFDLNPWEPSYPASIGQELLSVASHPAGPSSIQGDLLEAQSLFTKALDAEPLSGLAAAGVADADLGLAKFQKARARQDLGSALRAVQAAIRDNPLDSGYHPLLVRIQQAERVLGAKG